MRNVRSSLVGMLLAALTILTVGGCSRQKTSDKNLSYVDAAEAEVLVQGRKRLLGLGGAEVGTWLDPRGASAFQEGHIAGAINLPLEKLQTQHKVLEDYDVIIVYGSDYNSADAIATSKDLIARRYNVFTLRGGLRAWRAAGNPVEGESSE